MEGTYQFAGISIAICSLYEYVHEACQAYRTEEKAVFSIEISPEDILKERAFQEYEQRKIPETDFLEAKAVHRKIAEKLPFYNRFLLHGSAIAVEGYAYLFVAESGTGKSTHTRLWREMLGERAMMINDDKPLFSVEEENIMVYGTPYAGIYRLSNPISAPLKTLSFLNRGSHNHIHPVSPRDAFPQLMRYIYRPEDPEGIRKTLEMADILVRQIPCYEVFCNMEPSAAQLSYEVLSGNIFS